MAQHCDRMGAWSCIFVEHKGPTGRCFNPEQRKVIARDKPDLQKLRLLAKFALCLDFDRRSRGGHPGERCSIFSEVAVFGIGEFVAA